MKLAHSLRSIWTACGFACEDVGDYAKSVMAAETRHGVMMMSVFSLLLMLSATALHASLGLRDPHVYTFLALAALSLHILLSTRATRELRTLYMLAMTLLVISGSALVLLANKTSSFGAPLFCGVALLLMIVPMVPWGLREALGVMSLIYLMFTASTLSMPVRFSMQTLWALQFLMLSAAAISLTLVARSVGTRKQQIAARFALERSHQTLERMSLQDQLTGLWNRRYLTANFTALVDAIHASGFDCCFVLFDIDRFKLVNDQQGHVEGDRVLQKMARAYRAVLRPGEAMVRMGGDEFALLLASAEADLRLRQASALLREAPVESPGAAADSTISGGVVRIERGSAMAMHSAYALADDALYAAKRAGGNRFVAAPTNADARGVPAASASPA